MFLDAGPNDELERHQPVDAVELVVAEIRAETKRREDGVSLLILADVWREPGDQAVSDLVEGAFRGGRQDELEALTLTCLSMVVVSDG